MAEAIDKKYPGKVLYFRILGYVKYYWIALVIGVFGMAAIPLGNYVVGSSVLTYGGVGAAIGATFWNMTLRKRCKNCV